ncbi:glycoside hydrolase family 95 protein [Dinghuibacter silviterrae]|uniref:Alpha-L-fucosidase 2 n=1 Tax=Dinghuibacter silviterrae TaxID=1539049 RepID=A0A4R8DHG4_9BACT|nr:glycoside hydrolase family 95 protein [Dinghuibacter silviterrae]TDW96878.1 alpha-L-fucosidase 2 [Dinghuibacter silviterrae]
MKPLILFCALLPLRALCQLRLWYDRPATRWEETLPLGNGRLGMTPDGGVTHESIVLNDITLWSGSPQDANNYEAYKQLPRIRALLLQGKNDEAQALIDQSFICTGPGSGGTRYGCFQMLGRLDLDFGDGAPSLAPAPDAYHRELSLDSALARETYRVGGVTYTREYLTSFDHDVDIVRIRASKPGAINCKIGISRPERGSSNVTGDLLQLSGRLDNGTDGNGMQYLASVKAQCTDGTCRPEGNTLAVRGATELTIYVSAGTDFRDPGFRSTVARNLATAIHTPFAAELRQHVARYRALFGRLDLKIGDGGSALPTDERISAFHDHPEADNGMPVLFFQFGRYLSICSTRVGYLPPNLQGLWANDVHTPWNGDYHLDINVEMNHWPVEVTNLSELNLPLADLVKGMVPEGEKTAKAYYNAPGWVAHVITNVWGWTEPGESASWGVCKVGSGWLCSNLWDHYAFTNDRAYLADIYPVLKGAARFYNSMLIEDSAKGWWVTAPSSSPENTFYLPNGKTASICMGPTIDNQVIRELFDHVITASKVLGRDAAFRDTLATMLTKIPPPGVVAPDGRLMEWLENYKETDVHHRHISHLYGVYPATLITPDATPALAEACKKTLDARGDDGPSWSIAYKLLFWARLHEGDRAYRLFTTLIRPTTRTDINYGAGGGVYPNLLSAGPPFQIDGNFGATAGLAEMLLQSHEGYIDLLPALPSAWASSGHVRGLKARGNVTVDMTWKDGKVTDYRLRSATPHQVKIKVNGVIKYVRTS